MKTLIVYYSFTSNNAKLASYLKKQFNCDLAQVETTKSRNSFSIFLDLIFNRKPKLKPIVYDVTHYDQVIFIAPIWASKIATPMTSFLNDVSGKIKQYSFITICGGIAGQKEKIQSELMQIFQRPPVRLIEIWMHELLPGKNVSKEKYTTGIEVTDAGLDRIDRLQEFSRQKDLIDESSY